MENFENQATEAETVNVTVEELEDDSPVQVETVTTVDNDLIHLLAKIAARKDEKQQKRRPFYNLLGVLILVIAAYLAYTYFITKTNTTRGPVIILLMVIMAVTLLRYINTPIIQFMEQRMKPFLGQSWHYVASDDGIELTLNGQNATFQWEEIQGWWLEDGYYMMEINGQAIAFKQDNLDDEEEQDLKSLLYIYLGDAMPVNSEKTTT
jgi:hypothetical protein